MIAYFVRRLVGGIFTFFASTLVIFSVIIYAPGGPMFTLYVEDTDYNPSPTFLNRVMAFYHTDQPWPVSYMAWLFDPNGPKPLWHQEATSSARDLRTGMNIEIGNFHLRGSGVLTGDLGVSIIVEQGQPVTDVFGEGLAIMLLMALTLPVLMGVVVVQRRRRPPVYGLPPNYPMSRNLLDQRLCPMRVPGL